MHIEEERNERVCNLILFLHLRKMCEHKWIVVIQSNGEAFVPLDQPIATQYDGSVLQSHRSNWIRKSANR